MSHELARCPKKRCRAPLTMRGFDELGRIVLVCEPCELNRQGKCRRCVVGHLKGRKIKGFSGKYCPPCRKLAKAEADAVLDRRQAARRYYRNHRQECIQRARDYRAANPRTNLDRLYDTAKSRVRAKDPAKRENDRKVARRNYAKRLADPVYAAKERQRKAAYDARRALARREAVAA